MIRRDEVDNLNSCFNRADDLEMIFVLLARDPAAPAAIEAWIAERIRLGKNTAEDEQIQNASKCAYIMQQQRAGIWTGDIMQQQRAGIWTGEK